MSDIAIKVENLSKLYQLGTIGTGTLRNDLHRWWANARGKENPLSKIGVLNDRSKKAESEFVWSLKDIDFEVKKGEVLGIIGRNGAGKSTLLKILSKITSPTTGKINVNGRIASLLEVGTGFHPELTGRENIFMNGAILGMRKWEIQKKFDAIVDFSGVEGYIDTPVKRYSSGMYVRLAFAVAAFLEPEILIVDEVLAVGDAEFQKKCLGRMKDVSVNEGRTVLFVSHNLTAVSQLCNSGIILDNGNIICNDQISVCIQKYQNVNKEKHVYSTKEIPALEVPIINFAKIISCQEKISVEVHFSSPFKIKNVIIGLVLSDYLGNPVFGINNRFVDVDFNLSNLSNGKIVIEIGDLILHTGLYFVSIYLGDSISDFCSLQNVLSFSFKNEFVDNTKVPDQRHIGSVYIKNVKWKTIN